MTYRPPVTGCSGPTTQATVYWERLFGDDPLLCSVPGMGPITAPVVRAFLGDGHGFTTAKAAASYVAITPSNWSSGTVTQPSRSITKEGPGPRSRTVQVRPPLPGCSGRNAPLDDTCHV